MIEKPLRPPRSIRRYEKRVAARREFRLALQWGQLEKQAEKIELAAAELDFDFTFYNYDYPGDSEWNSIDSYNRDSQADQERDSDYFDDGDYFDLHNYFDLRYACTCNKAGLRSPHFAQECLGR